jgi:hypothetical protein
VIVQLSFAPAKRFSSVRVFSGSATLTEVSKNIVRLSEQAAVF